MSKTPSAESVKQINCFQTLRKTLLDDQRADDLEKPLAYWVLPGDRRLPLAFLGRTLGDLLDVSLEELAATPGIGPKKIDSFLKLLSRVARRKAPADPLISAEPPTEQKHAAHRHHGAPSDFNADLVSESHWEEWRETVRRHHLESETLGRLAPSLLELPTVIWTAPLSVYLDYSVAELRQLRTHGEKRVRAILEVFHSIHDVLGHAVVASHLTLQLVPKFLVPVEAWVTQHLQMPQAPTSDSVRQSLAIPLVHQVQIDCGLTTARMASRRLGIHGHPQSVKFQSKRLGVTRARVYQLLEQCQQALDLRWPAGHSLLRLLATKWEFQRPAPEGLQSLRAVTELFFPDD